MAGDPERNPSEPSDESVAERLETWAFLERVKVHQLIDSIEGDVEVAVEEAILVYPQIDELIQLRREQQARPPEVHYPYQQHLEL